MIYRAQHILPMDRGDISDGEILVQNDTIAAIGPGLSASYPDEPVCDLGNCLVLPGFVNAHCHLEYTLSRCRWDGLSLWDWIEREGYGLGRRPSKQLLEAASVIGAAELARSGVTCIADSSFSGAAAHGIDAAGLRGIVYLEVFGQSAGAEYERELGGKLDHAGKLQSQVCSDVTVGISPHSVYTSNRELLALCAGLDMPVAMHLAETRAEVDYVTSGVGPIAEHRRKLGYEPMVAGVTPGLYAHDLGLLRPGVCLAHCVHLTDREIELVAQSGVGVAHCARSNAFLGAGIAPVTKLMGFGAKVGLGTDSLGTSYTFDFTDEIRFALALHKAVAEDAAVITAKDVLIRATLGGAEALGMAADVGSLTVGKRADFVAFDIGNPLPCRETHLSIASKSAADVAMVVVGGREIVRNGVNTNVDLREHWDLIKKELEL